MDKKVVAKVNGKEISQDDVLRFLTDVGPEVAMQFQSPEGIQKVVDELVNQELLYLDAMENNLNNDAEFKNIIEDTKIVLLKNYAIGKLLSTEKVSEEEAIEYYNNNKDKFTKPETAIASHILIESEDKANEIINEINNGKSFEDAAKEYSTCPSNEKGGNLGEFGRGQMVAEFEDAVFTMEEGSISAPVKTQFGYHIIKLIEKKESGFQEFEKTKNKIMQVLMGIKQQKVYLDKVNELKLKYSVELFKN